MAHTKHIYEIAMYWHQSAHNQNKHMRGTVRLAILTSTSLFLSLLFIIKYEIIFYDMISFRQVLNLSHIKPEETQKTG